jgi:hypothetical protein
MKLSDVQKVLNDYFKSKDIMLIGLQISRILVLIYPIYLLLCQFTVLSVIVGIVGPILYFIYIMGLVLSFSKNDMLALGVAFGLRACSNLFSIIMYSFNTSFLLNIAVYAILAILSWNQFTAYKRQ